MKHLGMNPVTGDPNDKILPFSARQKSSSLQTGEPDKPTGYRNGVLQWDDDSTSLHGWEMVV